ncbi:hypothetical protein F4678DRAFT_242894 [Xylaria arbuscula]|nr:hypothetical protein F4678DRAFT_242894 [Xylaria arbuscula]
MRRCLISGMLTSPMLVIHCCVLPTYLLGMLWPPHPFSINWLPTGRISHLRSDEPAGVECICIVRTTLQIYTPEVVQLNVRLLRVG